MKRPQRSTPSLVFLIMVGVLLANAGLQYDGFFGGMAQGAGVALMLVAVWAFGAMWRHGQDDEEQTWLPSRDER